jgi:hypothetical protein
MKCSLSGKQILFVFAFQGANLIDPEYVDENYRRFNNRRFYI